jgi:hypothetical protein
MKNWTTLVSTSSCQNQFGTSKQQVGLGCQDAKLVWDFKMTS